jgi:signal transduction histidine kinase
MRPLDPLSSIKTKLGVVIVGAVVVTVGVVTLGARFDLHPLLLGAIAGLLALVMVQFLARGMTSPLREMAHAASAMARGDYDRRVTASWRDEVGDLARAFNQMAADLAEVDRVRRDLVANVSHELRTPISALQAVLENLVDGVEPPDPETLRVMLNQVERLGRLVSQLLDLSRLESGVVPLQRVSFELRPLLEQALEESRLNDLSRADRRVDLVLSADPGVTAEGDPERVHQVVSNLLTNAVQHSPDGGEVLLSARANGALVTIEVADEGPGIPPAEASRVFERFYRSDAARSSSDGGTGLGLAIARWIVDLHNGDIRVESRVPRGCLMVVELPRARA